MARADTPRMTPVATVMRARRRESRIAAPNMMATSSGSHVQDRRREGVDRPDLGQSGVFASTTSRSDSGMVTFAAAVMPLSTSFCWIAVRAIEVSSTRSSPLSLTMPPSRPSSTRTMPFWAAWLSSTQTVANCSDATNFVTSSPMSELMPAAIGAARLVGEAGVREQVAQQGVDLVLGVDLRDDLRGDGLGEGLLHLRLVDQRPDGLDVALAVDDRALAPVPDQGGDGEHRRQDDEQQGCDRIARPSASRRPLADSWCPLPSDGRDSTGAVASIPCRGRHEEQPDRRVSTGSGRWSGETTARTQIPATRQTLTIMSKRANTRPRWSSGMYRWTRVSEQTFTDWPGEADADAPEQQDRAGTASSLRR